MRQDNLAASRWTSKRRTPLTNLLQMATALLLFSMPGLLLSVTQSTQEKGLHREQTIKTKHTIQINGTPLTYLAFAGIIKLRNDEHKPTASIFYTAYLKESANNPDRARSLTFIFNGGPGSSSIWLHVGAFGPKRIQADVDQNPQGPPYKLQHNEQTLLNLSDLVFIDPVSTGFSRAAEGEDPGQFHEVTADIESMAQFILRFLSQYKRWDSPIFIIGESYGAARAAGLVDLLQRRHRLYPTGVVLVAPALNYQTFFYNAGNDLPYILTLPTFAATAWYHGKLSQELQADFHRTLCEARNFTLKDYSWALNMGSALGQEERNEILRNLARYSGLSETTFEDANLRLDRFTFASKLMEGRQLGVLDSRFVGFRNFMAAIPLDGNYGYVLRDPFLPQVDGIFASAFNHYVREDLRYETDLVYEPLLSSIARSWKYDVATNSHLNMADNLRAAMTQNPRLKVFMAAGYYDLVTTHLATEYIATHLGIDQALSDNISIEFYEAGHMMYLHEPSLQKMKGHLKQFYESRITDAPERQG